MKSALHRVLALLLTLVFVFGLVPAAAAANGPFTDVAEGDWYFDYVLAAYEQGLMSGVSDTAFDPEGGMTRAMFVTVLGRVMGVSASGGGWTGFEDVSADSYYAPYVAWAVAMGITYGVSDSLFAPDDLVNREQAAAFLSRALDAEGVSLPENGTSTDFRDDGDISDWARESVREMALAGIFVGDENDNFNPGATMTRAEGATIFVRFAAAYASAGEEEINSAYDFEADDIDTDEATGITYVNNILLVFFETGASEAQRQAVVEAVDGEIAGRMDTIDQLQIRVSARDLDGLEALCAQVEAMAGVETAAYDLAGQYEADAIPDDPWGSGIFHKEEWDVSNPDGNNWWAELIDAPGAWDYADELDTVTVGVVDNGFDDVHEDVDMRVLNAGTLNTEDHGTHVAGIVGATHDNGKGISGVAPNAELVCYDWQPSWIQELVGGWDTTASIMVGLVECVENGAKVVNFSVGKSGSLPSNSDSYAASVLDAESDNVSRYVAALIARGFDFLIVQSAGNGAEDNIGVDAINNGLFASITAGNYTASFGIQAQEVLDRILVVASCGRPDENGLCTTTVSSNGGSQVGIAAPGSSVYSTVAGGYDTMGGTSMAAPMVAGAAAVVWGMDSTLTGPEVKEALVSNCGRYTANNTGSPNTTGTFPLLNVRRAVEAVRGEKLQDYGYLAVMLEYFAACTAGQDEFLNAWEQGEYQYINATEVNDFYNYGYTLYTAEYDINFDDQPELLVAKEESGDYVIIGAFGFDGEGAVNLFGGEGDFGYRVRLYLCQNGVLCVQGSSSAFSGSADFYRIATDGYSLEHIDSYAYDTRDPDSMTYEEFADQVARYPRRDHRELSWSLLIDGSGEEPAPGENEALLEAVLAAENVWSAVFASYDAMDTEVRAELFFMDMDFDGVPELVIQSPPGMGSGNYRYTRIYGLRDGRLVSIEPSSVESDWLWDELSLYQDMGTGEYFFLGYDYARAGMSWYTIGYAKYVFSGGDAVEASPLFSYGSEGGTMRYTFMGETVSESTYNDRVDAYWQGVRELGLPRSVSLITWDAGATDAQKRETLRLAIESTPDMGGVEDAIGSVSAAFSPSSIVMLGMAEGEGGPFYFLQTDEADGWHYYYVEPELTGCWCAGQGQVPFASGSNTYYYSF